MWCTCGLWIIIPRYFKTEHICVYHIGWGMFGYKPVCNFNVDKGPTLMSINGWELKASFWIRDWDHMGTIWWSATICLRARQPPFLPLDGMSHPLHKLACTVAQALWRVIKIKALWRATLSCVLIADGWYLDSSVICFRRGLWLVGFSRGRVMWRLSFLTWHECKEFWK